MVAHHIRMPGIVLFLLLGVVLGPDGFHIIRPETMGEGLETLVGMAVAVILFEGGLNLSISRLRRAAKVIRRLIGVGALMTWLGGTLAAHFVLGWAWATSLLFGSLIIVTGPTVIAPLVRRIRLTPKIATILEAEGVLIDPVGAIIAVVVLEEVIGFASGDMGVMGLIGIPSRLILGGVLGVVWGLAIGFLLKRRGLIPDGLENVFTLGMALAGFAVSNAIMPESGIMQAAIAGMVVGNMETGQNHELREFKEQLTVMLVGLLFVLLAANVRIADVLDLGWRAVAAICVLMFVVRPLVVAYATSGSDLDFRERAFIAWLAPRGIVAAAVAALFAQRLTDAGMEGGAQLQGLVFLVIAITVVVQGVSGAWVAEWLGLRLPRDNGYVIAGAHALGRALGESLRAAGHEVLFVDTNPQQARAAEDEGFQVAYGNAADESVLRRLDIEGRRGFIALTPNPGVNLLLCNTVQHSFSGPKRFSAVVQGRVGIRGRRVVKDGHTVLFGRAIDLPSWIHHLDSGSATSGTWRFQGADGAPHGLNGNEPDGIPFSDGRDLEAQFVPLTLTRNETTGPVGGGVAVEMGDLVSACYLTSQKAQVEALLQASGWKSVDVPASEDRESEPEVP